MTIHSFCSSFLQCISTDVCVPISKLTEMIIETQQDIKDAKVFGMLSCSFPQTILKYWVVMIFIYE